MRYENLNIIQILTVYIMNQQTISLQPEIVHFSSDSKQLIKISNRSSEVISNCFFCHFNPSKYQFSPDSFKLDPWEHKIVTVTLLNKNIQYQPKEFAYIKSKNFSKRFTLCHDVNLSQDKLVRSPSSGFEDMYTLSSRDYRQTQKNAFDRVIAEKQAYIKRLQRRLQQQQSNRKDRSFTSEGKTKNYYAHQIEQLESKIEQSNKQKQQLIMQNKVLSQKLKQNTQRLQQISTMNANELQKQLLKKQQVISKLKQEINYLEQQCESLYASLSQKQEKLHKYESKNEQMISQLTKQCQKKLKQLQKKLDEEKKKKQKNFSQKIKKLQQKLSQSQIERSKKQELEELIYRKQQQVATLTKQLQQQKKKRKLQEENKKKSFKTQLHNSNLIQENSVLKEKILILEKSVDQLREQTIMFKSKIDSPNDKASKYMAVALESCQNQNQILKKSRKQLQYSLAQESRHRKIYQSKYMELQSNIRTIKQQIRQLQIQKQELLNKSRISRDESYETIIKLRSQNIDLIEKMSFGKKDDLQRELHQSKIKLEKSEEEMRRIKNETELLTMKYNQQKEAKDKMSKKVEKYKRETTKQLKSISQSTVDQLKKLRQQKKKLQQKVNQLQKYIKDIKQRPQTQLHLDSTNQNIKNQTRTRYPPSQSERRTGIKNQRKQIQQSTSFLKNQQLEQIYSELGQLRQFKNYINMEINKIKNILYTTGHENSLISENNGLIFNCVHIFQILKSRVLEQNTDRQKIAQTQKQLAFLKGRLTQIETISKNMKGSDNIDQRFSAIQGNRIGDDRGLLEMVRQEMKIQYKKLYDSLQISQDRFEILKKKIYEQYRSRIIGLINSKERTDNMARLIKIQSVLERFVDGLGNRSHKEAILAKQVRLKQQARKQAGALKQKVGHLNNLLQTRKGYCSRDPIKVYGCSNESQWHDNIRLQAKMLTYQAQNARLFEELNFYSSQSKNFEERLKLSFDQLQMKEQQITKLKKQVIQIESLNAKQLIKRQQDIEQLQRKFLTSKDEMKQNEGRKIYEKQLTSMRQEIQRKKQIIKSLKQKEKMLEQLIQSSNRSDESTKNKNKKDLMDEIRFQQSLREFRENNRQLRAENARLKEQISNLQSQLEKKNTAIKRYKGQGEQYRIKAVKQDHEEAASLKKQVRQLKDQLKISKGEIQKIKKKKEKQILELQSELRRTKNEYLIQKSSLESIVRALSDNISRLYSDLCIILKKRGKSVKIQADFQQLLVKPGQIDSIKVYQSFQQILTALKN